MEEGFAAGDLEVRMMRQWASGDGVGGAVAIARMPLNGVMWKGKGC